MASVVVVDRGSEVLAVIWTLTGLSGLVLGLRIYCKILRHRGLWWDDYVLIASWFCLLSPTVVTTLEVQLGFGKHVGDINPANLGTLGLYGQVTAFLSILGALLSKTSFAITMLRISHSWVKICVWISIISMNIFMLLSAVFTWTNCSPVQKIWDSSVPGTCWDRSVLPTYNTFSGAYSGIMDLFLAMIPWAIIPKLQMKTAEKFGVAIAMSMGVFAAATAFVKCVKLQTLASGDFTFDGCDLVIWGAAETATTVMATSIPVLRALFNELKSASRSYLKSGNGKDPHSSSKAYGQPSKNNTIITTTARPVHRGHGKVTSMDDSASDKSILPDKGVQVLREVELSYNRMDGDEERGYEMNRFDEPHFRRNEGL